MRLIDADALLADARRCRPICRSMADIVDIAWLIEDQPTVNAKPVVHGRCDWCKQGDERCGTCKNFFTDDGSRCSAEHDDIRCAYYEPMNFCPNCGAKMDGD